MKRKTLIVIMLLINPLFDRLIAQILVNEKSLITTGGIVYLKNELFTGTSLCFYSNGQIKSKMDISAGKKSGFVEEYFESKDFESINFKDTAIISKSNAQISEYQELLKKSLVDSLDLTKQMLDFVNYKLGGEKKYLKMYEKNNKGKLKKKDKELFDQYLLLEQSMKILIANNKNTLQELKRLKERVTNEQNKPIFEPRKLLEYEITEGIKNGSYKKYNAAGYIIEEGTFTNGKFTGEWIFRYLSGIILAKGKYYNGDGSEIGDSGVPKNGREGLWLFYYDNGKLKEESNYVHGKLEGTLKVYYDNGNLSEESHYVNGESEGTFKLYYNNGKLKQDSQVRNGKLEGTAKVYYDSGKLKKDSQFRNGRLEGVSKLYYENGKLNEEVHYVNDKRDGTVKIYYENGKLKSVCQRKNDKLVGKVTTYYENGKIEAIGHADPEDPEGDRYFIEKSYSPDGTLLTDVTQNNSNINALKQKHSCEWCGRTFTGLGWFASQSNFYGEHCQAQEKSINLGSWFCSKKCATEECIHNQ